MGSMMRDLRNAIWFVVGIIIAMVTYPVLAEDYSAVPKYGISYGTATHSSPEAAGAWVCTNYGSPSYGYSFAGFGYPLGGAYVDDGAHDLVYCDGGSYGVPNYVGYGVNTYLMCPGGGSLSGSMCVGATACTAPQTRVDGVCTGPACPAAGEYGTGAAARGTSVVGSGPSLPSSLCINSCEYEPGQVGVWAGGEWASDVGAATGASCSGTAPTASPCPSGQMEATINSVTTCLPASSVPGATVQSNNSTTAVTANAGGTTTGTTTTNTTTSCTGSVCTESTVTTTRDGSGAVTGTVTTISDKARDPFCRENPQSVICRATSFGGTCGAFSCDGDGVQCAIAQEQHRQRCELDTAAAPTTGTIGEVKDALAGTPDPTGDAFRNPSPTSLSSAIDQTDALSGAACPGPWSVSVLSTSFNVSVEPVCDLAGYIRPLIIAFALFLAVRIALGGL